jgi:hypothetical protein
MIAPGAGFGEDVLLFITVDANTVKIKKTSGIRGFILQMYC